MRKKLLSFCLAMAMIVSTTPSLAFAANSAQTDNPTKVEQKVGDVSEVKSIEELKVAIEKGGKIKLTGNIEYSDIIDLNITKEVELDLNGFKIINNGGQINHYMMVIKDNGSLTINDSKGGGIIEATSKDYGYGIQLYSNAKFVMNGGTIKTTQESVDIYTISKNVKIEINGGKLISTKDNVLGIRGNKDIVVDINGGELSALDGRTGIYVSSYDENAITINFKGGKLIHNGGMSGAIQVYSGATVNLSGDAVIESSSSYGIQLQSGNQKSTLKITGGTVKTSGWNSAGVSVRDDKSELIMSGGTIDASGAGITVDNSPTVRITDGKIISKNKVPVKKGSSYDEKADIEVSGGQFNGTIPEEFLAKDAAPHKYGDWKVTLDPTFAKDGIKERVCDICGAKEEAKIDKLDASKYSVDKVTGIKTYINGDKKTFTVKFNKVQDAYNYTVAYKLNGAKKWTYKSTNGATSYKMKLKAGDTIEARVCANMTVADKTFRSKYSASTYRMIGNHDVKSVMSYSKRNLALSWAKAKNNYKGAKLYYNVAYKTNNGKFKVKSVSANKMNLKVVSGKYYQVKVRPVVKVGSKKYIGSYEGAYANRYAKSSYIKSLRSGDNKLKVTIGKVSGVTGYQVVYAPNKSFKGQKYYTNKGSSNVKRTISKLKSDKRYYVKIRAYKQVNGVKYYGPYSKIINLKTW